MTRRKTTEKFIEQARTIHNETYDYDKVEYVNSNTKVIITCPEHGDFEQVPPSHLRGRGCPTCGVIKIGDSLRMSKSEFIQKAKEMHGDTYGYDKVEYVNNYTKVIINCPQHGDFTQTPHEHIDGSGCPACSGNIRLTTEEFIQKAEAVHGDTYGYDKVEYVNNYTKVIINCPQHGDFTPIPANHIKGHGCPACGLIKQHDSLRMSQSEFIQKAKEIHGDEYDYDKVVYVNFRTKIIITCQKHGDFQQSPGSHLRGRGCPRCYHKAEGKIAIYLNLRHVVHREFRIDNKFFDFYLPDYNLIIERDGEQHYPKLWNRGRNPWNVKALIQSFSEEHQNDIDKTKLAKENSYKIARIPYWLDDKEVELEIENILAGKPTYPDIPDPKQEKNKPLPGQTLKS